MFALQCRSYDPEGKIPSRYAHGSVGGKNTSPGFAWHDGPISTKSFAFSIVDPHPVARNWVHWMIVDIPFNAREIPEGASCTGKMPKGTRELMNTDGEQGYGGPAPPAGSGPHPYVATLYALNVEKLDLPKNASLRQFLNAIEGKVIAEVEMRAFFEIG